MTTPDTNPPVQTNMTAAPKQTRMVKLRAIRDFRYKTPEGEEKIVTPGNTADVPEDQAKELCDKAFEGNYAFSGERYATDGDAKKHQLVRAERVK